MKSMKFKNMQNMKTWNLKNVDLWAVMGVPGNFLCRSATDWCALLLFVLPVFWMRLRSEKKTKTRKHQCSNTNAQTKTTQIRPDFYFVPETRRQQYHWLFPRGLESAVYLARRRTLQQQQQQLHRSTQLSSLAARACIDLLPYFLRADLSRTRGINELFREPLNVARNKTLKRLTFYAQIRVEFFAIRKFCQIWRKLSLLALVRMEIFTEACVHLAQKWVILNDPWPYL